jgi:hypothetical protein
MLFLRSLGALVSQDKLMLLQEGGVVWAGGSLSSPGNLATRWAFFVSGVDSELDQVHVHSGGGLDGERLYWGVGKCGGASWVLRASTAEEIRGGTQSQTGWLRPGIAWKGKRLLLARIEGEKKADWTKHSMQAVLAPSLGIKAA